MTPEPASDMTAGSSAKMFGFDPLNTPFSNVGNWENSWLSLNETLPLCSVCDLFSAVMIKGKLHMTIVGGHKYP